MKAVGKGIQLAGALKGADALEAAGEAQAAAYNEKAGLLINRSRQRIPIAQREAGEISRVNRIMVSDAAAGYKGGGTDPSVVKRQSQRAKVGRYGAALALASGAVKQVNDEYEAKVNVRSGARAKEAGYAAAEAKRVSAWGGLIAGLGKDMTLASKYGANQYGGGTDDPTSANFIDWWQ